MSEPNVPDLSQAPKRFAIFVVCILMATAISTYGATFFLLSSAFDEVQQDYTDEATLRVETDLTRYIDTRLAALTDEADNSIYVNAAMHPLADVAALSDHMRKQVLLRQNVKLSLLDINGSSVQSTFAETGEYSKYTWVAQLVDGDIQSFSEIRAANNSSELSLRLAVPVSYRGLPEGVLVGEVPLSNIELERALNQSLDTLSLSFIQSNDALIGSIGSSPSSKFISTTISLENSATKIRLFLDPHSLDGTLNKILLVNMLITLFLAGLFLFIFQNIGNRIFVRPQQLLEEAQQETEKTNALLNVANDELSQFAYRSSHDLRAPLITVQGLVNFARQDLASGDLAEVDNNLVKVAKHAKKLDSLVGGILDLSRADFVDRDETQVDVPSICKDIQARLLDGGNLGDFELRLDNQLGRPFFSQKARIAQLLENLISNAAKYQDLAKPEQFVRVAMIDEREGTLLIVEDNGLGFPAEVLDQVFTKFKRFHPNVSTGSGLGLSIVKKHIDQLDGIISFSSSEAGTRFEIFLPSQRAAMALDNG